MNFTSHDTWGIISDTWMSFQDNWNGESPPIPPVVDLEGANLGMGEIPHVEIVPYEKEIEKKKTKIIEMVCIVGTETFTMKREAKENRVFFNVKRIKFDINKINEPKLSVITV